MSRVGGREGETFVSPTEQRQRIADACSRDGLELVETFDELDVSGGAPLNERPGLSRALALVEAGEAQVVVVAYFDRLVRSVSRQAEILERVESAGGAILAVDVGEVRADTASHWLSSTMLGAVNEYHRRVTAERTVDAKRRAVARGVPPFPNLPPGLERDANNKLRLNKDEIAAVREAFRLRANGATVMEVRRYLREHGIERSFHGVQTMLGSRLYLGELRFGSMVNPQSHPPIVDAVTWQRVQRMRSTRGRRPKSDRLLARLGVLRCATCGARMVVGSTREGYAFYRCNPTNDCPRRVTISAAVAERVIVNDTKRLIADMRGKASLERNASAAEEELAKRQDDLDKAIRNLAGFEDEPAARERLTEFRELRDAARERVAGFEHVGDDLYNINVEGDWEDLSRDVQRRLIRLAIERADVEPGRGNNRITVYPR